LPLSATSSAMGSVAGHRGMHNVRAARGYGSP
jgi:hypothetical protein